MPRMKRHHFSDSETSQEEVCEPKHHVSGEDKRITRTMGGPLIDQERQCVICHEDCIRDVPHLTCTFCRRNFHCDCMGWDGAKIIICRAYRWECVNCKRCTNCRKRIVHKNSFVICQTCDRSYHKDCVEEEIGNPFTCTICSSRFHDRNSKKDLKCCPITDCNSEGHLSGKYPSHYLKSTCPLYHNLTVQECIDEAQSRRSEKRAEEVNKIKQEVHQTRRPVETAAQLAYREKLICERTYELPNLDSLVERLMEHSGKHMRQREPLLAPITSKWDLELFREVQRQSAQEAEDERQEALGYSGIEWVVVGDHEIRIWFSAPYPEPFQHLLKIYICEYCLKPMASACALARHDSKCVWRHPPGNEIYRKGTLSVFEVDGRKRTTYCQNMCLFAKMFLDHKTLYHDVEPFLFYIAVETDTTGCHVVGYFSKEKESFNNYNLSCILVWPQHMRKGYGRFLIAFSYELSRREGKLGSPERPLSDLGLRTYRAYWQEEVMKYIMGIEGDYISVKDISQKTCIHSGDIVSTLQYLGLLKYFKGRHIVLRKQECIENFVVQQTRKTIRTVDPSCLHWSPSTVNANTDI